MTLILCHLPISASDPCEQGGILLGRGNQVLHATGPLPDDHREPGLLMLLDAGHQAAANAHPDLDYLGYWHTHPRDQAQPSEVDLTDWRVAVRAMERPLYFPIIGTDGLRVFRLCPGQRAPEEVPWTY